MQKNTFIVKHRQEVASAVAAASGFVSVPLSIMEQTRKLYFMWIADVWLIPDPLNNYIL